MHFSACPPSVSVLNRQPAAKEAAAKHGMSLNAWVAYAISRELGSENGCQSVEAVLAATNPQTWKKFVGK